MRARPLVAPSPAAGLRCRENDGHSRPKTRADPTRTYRRAWEWREDTNALAGFAHRSTRDPATGASRAECLLRDMAPAAGAPLRFLQTGDTRDFFYVTREG